MSRPPRTRPARRASTAAPEGGAFSSFLARDAAREKRRKSRRRTLLISVAVHVALIFGVLVYSLWRVEELWSPSVEVKVFSPSKLPPGVLPSPAPPAKPTSPTSPTPPTGGSGPAAAPPRVP